MRVLVLLLMASCAVPPVDVCLGAPGACVRLTVSSSAALSIDTVRVTASGAADGVHSAAAPMGESLPIDVPLALPASAAGPLDLYVEGLSVGAVLATGEVALNVNFGEHSHATADIEPPVVVRDDMGTGIDLDQACADLAQSRCERTASCSPTAPTLITRDWGDLDTCKTRVKLDCLAESAAPGGLWTVAAVENCAAAFTQQPCPDRLDAFRPTVCTLAGTRSDGSACVYDSQCSSSNCHRPSGVACGVCAAVTVAGSTSCASKTDCSGRQVCASNVCHTQVALGGTCSASAPCGEGLACVGGLCRAEAASAGAPCDSTLAAAADCNLDLGWYCASTDKCAVVGLATLAKPACGLILGVRTVCADGADCYSGTCKQPSSDGGACDVAVGPSCRYPARCVTNPSSSSGICKLPSPATCK